MTVHIEGRIGIVLLLILGIVVAVGILAGFSIPGVVLGAWLLVGCILGIVGI
jgi:hypothetical protein